MRDRPAKFSFVDARPSLPRALPKTSCDAFLRRLIHHDPHPSIAQGPRAQAVWWWAQGPQARKGRSSRSRQQGGGLILDRAVVGLIMINSRRMGAAAAPLALLLLLPGLANAVLPTGEIRFQNAPGYTYCAMAVRLRFDLGLGGRS